MEHQEMTPQESPHITWRSILGGEVLVHLMRKQANLIILIMILVILYIDNRYSSQQEMIEIDRLKKELIDTKYDALTISSELTEKSRQSRIEEYISAEGAPLETASTPPYLIKTRTKMVPGQKISYYDIRLLYSSWHCWLLQSLQKRQLSCLQSGNTGKMWPTVLSKKM